MKINNSTLLNHLENTTTKHSQHAPNHLTTSLQELAQQNICASLPSFVTPNPEHLLKQTFQSLRANLLNEASSSTNTYLQSIDILESRGFKPKLGGLLIPNTGAALGGRRSNAQTQTQTQTLLTRLREINIQIQSLSREITVIQEDMSYTTEGSQEQIALQNELAPLEENLAQLEQIHQQTTNEINRLHREDNNT
jgi:hypothetical protein